MSGDLSPVGGDRRTRYSVSVAAVDELSTRNEVRLGSAGPDLTITDGLDGAFAEISARLSSEGGGGWAVFGDARSRANDEYSEAGTQVGTRLRR